MPLILIKDGTDPACVHEHFTINGRRPRVMYTCTDCGEVIEARGGRPYDPEKWPTDEPMRPPMRPTPPPPPPVSAHPVPPVTETKPG